MADITKIPLDELLQDLEDSKNDIVACRTGLAIGVTDYPGEDGEQKSVSARMKVNYEIIEVIRAELKRRGIQVVTFEVDDEESRLRT